MIALDPLAAAYLHLAAFGIGVECRMKSAPQINVVASGVDPVIDHSKGIAELNGFKPMLSADSPYGAGVETHIEGLSHGKIGMTGEVEFATETWDMLGKGCVYVQRVDVRISLDPTIYIAREYAKGSCHYNAVLRHERKHWKVDRDVVNKYTSVIVRGVNAALEKDGFVHGPLPRGALGFTQEKIGQSVNDVVDGYAEKLNAERLARQKRVDTLDEYRRVAAECTNSDGTRRP